MIYGDFSLIPLILVITLQNRKTMFCVFLCFGNLLELKLTCDFSGVNVLSREPSRVQEVNEEGHDGQTSTGGTGPGQGAPPMLKWASSLRCRPSSSPDSQLDLKTPL
jgi:hypothetical protein